MSTGGSGSGFGQSKAMLGQIGQAGATIIAGQQSNQTLRSQQPFSFKAAID